MPTHPSIDPLAASTRIEHDYRSYLQTSFNLADPALRRDLERGLDEGRRIRRGPILQATPPYRQGATVAALVDEGVLHPGLLDCEDDVLPGDRPLYAHQEAALRAVRSERNLVVATGTGSGKTECYLLPVLDHLLRERAAGTLSAPGVRALLLYPMNALANDQMKRIRELFAAYPDVTFGRYVGDTPDTHDAALDRYRQQHRAVPLPNELIDRESMKASPPHVLLTNYAMLEFLLLRPADSSLFDGPTGGHWRFVVLDEVHVYDGARGTELGMLLRRVRDRVHRSDRGRLRCIGTSATLGRGSQDAPAVAAFARDLFDEDFEPRDVIQPQRLGLRHGESEWKLTPDALTRLHELWQQGAPASQLADAVREHAGHTVSTADASAEAVLHVLLRSEHHVIELQRQLEERSLDLDALAEIMDGFPDPARAVVRLVDLGIAARNDDRSAPLIPARYHLFVRASEGAYVCWGPDHPVDEPRICLDRHDECPACADHRVKSHMFELAVCRHCGADYMVGTRQDDRLLQAASHQRQLVHVLRDATARVGDELDEDEEAIAGQVDGRSDRAELCCGCGHLGDCGSRSCDCTRPATIAVTVHNVRKGDEFRRCVACGRHSTTGVTLRFQSGSEAPLSVIATSLYQCLPALPAAATTRRASAGGRKLLMFSDSRQDAAFFAPYLRRTYSRAIERRCIWSVLRDDPEPYRLDDLVQPVRRLAERAGVLDEDEGRRNRSEVRAWLMAEILATDRRQSLDGLGLAEIAPRIPAKLDPPAALTPLRLTDEEAFDTLRLLLDTARQSAAVAVPDDVDVREDPRFAPRNVTTRLRRTGSEAGVIAWVPGRGLNRRLDLVEKIARSRGVDVDGRRLLEDVWLEITDPDSPLATVLPAHDERGRGTVFTLDPDQIEFAATSKGHRPYRCDRCRQVWWRNVAGVCATYRCPGRLRPHDRPEPNHYRHLYEHLEPLRLAVEEHTGQLSTERAAELQEQFVRGKLNALSCSTTFELGVDVGEVQAVLMRNVPPSAANYVQRAGRAGRRLGSAALVVTFAQRRSHDLHFFENPASMVDGHVRPPILVMDNEAVVRRHVHAVAWSSFERERVEAGHAPTSDVDDLVGDDTGRPGVAEEFLGWLRRRPTALQERLIAITPPAVAEALDLRGWAWVERLHERDRLGVGGWLTEAVADVRRDLDELADLEQQASTEGKHRRAGALQLTCKTLSGRRALDFLAQRGVLPKYGFPVDVVDLDLSRCEEAKGRIELNRDLRLGILEFAPGARVVAANRLWQSIGIRKPPGKELPIWEWGICDGCGVLRSQIRAADADRDELLTDPCGCGSTGWVANRRGAYLIPLFGFVGDSDPKPPGETRPPREGYLETYFAEYEGPPPETETVDLGGLPIQVRMSRRGWITVFNRGRTGRGFSFCFSCGYASDGPRAPRRGRGGERPAHTAPGSSRECRGWIGHVDLGHRYMTNVMELEIPLKAASIDRDTAALSALHGLLAALPTIDVSQQDVGGSLSVGPTGRRSMVLYDEVPGGAGHTRYIRDRLPDLAAGALSRLSSCSCGLDTSCYGCLRTFRNQRDHDQLNRRAAIEILKSIQ